MPDKSYKIGKDVYDIPDKDVATFVADNPDAQEVQSFVAGKDTFDIPVAEVQDFISEMPEAKPLKKKVGTEGGGGTSAGGTVAGDGETRSTGSDLTRALSKGEGERQPDKKLTAALEEFSKAQGDYKGRLYPEEAVTQAEAKKKTNLEKKKGDIINFYDEFSAARKPQFANDHSDVRHYNETMAMYQDFLRKNDPGTFEALKSKRNYFSENKVSAEDKEKFEANVYAKAIEFRQAAINLKQEKLEKEISPEAMKQLEELDGAAAQQQQLADAGSITPQQYNQNIGQIKKFYDKTLADNPALQEQEALSKEGLDNYAEMQSYVERFPKEAARQLEQKARQVETERHVEASDEALIQAGGMNQVGRAVTEFAGKFIGIPQAVTANNEYGWTDRMADVGKEWAESVNETLFPQPARYDKPLVEDKKAADGSSSKQMNMDLLLPKAVRTIADMGILVGGAYATGGALTAAGVPQTAALATGTVASSFALTAKDYYDEAIDAGLEPKKASAFSIATSLVVGMGELINPEAIVFRKQLVGKLTKNFVKHIAEGVSWQEATKQVGKTAFKNIVHENVQEHFQNFSEYAIKYATNELAGTEFRKPEIYNEALETTILTTIAAGLFGTGGAFHKEGVSELEKKSLWTATHKLPELQQRMDAMVQDGGMKQEEADKITEVVTALKNNLDAVPGKKNEKEQEKLVELFYQKLKINDATNKEGIDDTVKEAHSENVAAVDEKINEIINPKANETEPSDKSDGNESETNIKTETNETEQKTSTETEKESATGSERVHDEEGVLLKENEELKIKNEKLEEEINLVKGVEEAINGYEEGDDIFSDLVGNISIIANDNDNVDELTDAVSDFLKEQEYNRKLKGRGDMDAAEEEFMRKIKMFIADKAGKEKVKEDKVPDKAGKEKDVRKKEKENISDFPQENDDESPVHENLIEYATRELYKLPDNSKAADSVFLKVANKFNGKNNALLGGVVSINAVQLKHAVYKDKAKTLVRSLDKLRPDVKIEPFVKNYAQKFRLNEQELAKFVEKELPEGSYGKNEKENISDFPQDIKEKSVGEPKPEILLKGKKNKFVGKNAEGELLYEDENGVRSKSDNGRIFSTEPVGIVPTKSGVETHRQERTEDYKTEEEIKGEEKPAAPKGEEKDTSSHGVKITDFELPEGKQQVAVGNAIIEIILRGTKNIVSDEQAMSAIDVKDSQNSKIAAYTFAAKQYGELLIPVLQEYKSGIWKHVEKNQEKIIYAISKKVLAKAGEKPPAPKGEKTAKRKVRDEKVNKELDDLWGDFRKKGKVTSGLDPEQLAVGLKIVAAYTKAGVFKLSDIIEDAYSRMGEEVGNLADAIKAAYNAYRGSLPKEERAKMDNEDTVGDLDIKETVIKFAKENERNSTLPDEVSGDSPELDDGKRAAGAAAETTGEQAEGVSEQDSETSGKGEGQTFEGRQSSGDSGGETAKRTGAGRNTGRGKPGKSAKPATEAAGEDAPGTVTSPQPSPKEREEKRNEHNFSITDATELVPAGEIGKIKANIEAIRIVKNLEKENRPATEEEKKKLVQFTGWGGVSAVLNEERYDDAWEKKYKKYQEQIKELLTEDEFTDAVNSTINAHYTSSEVIKNLWDLAGHLGFKGGTVLESSAGIGHFFGLMPEELKENTVLKAYELDKVSGAILKALYPEANVQVTGFENSKVAPSSVDLAITNVPFAQSSPFDEANPDLSKFSLHNYFIAKNIKLLKPGGVGIFITSYYTMDSEGGKFRQWVTDEGNADFVGAVRLPNTAFLKNAGTEVTTDILVFRKRDGEMPADFAEPFRYTKTVKEKVIDEKRETIDINEYYVRHPEQMLGEMKFAEDTAKGGLYSKAEQTLAARPGQDTEKLLKEAIQRLPKDITESAAPGEVEDSMQAEEKDKEGTLVDRDGIYEVINGELFKPTWSGESVKIGNKTFKKDKIAGEFLGIKESIKKLITLEKSEDATDEQIEEERKKLNERYDAFEDKYTTFNRNPKIDFLEDDSEHNIVYALEDITTKGELSEKGKLIKRYFIEKAPIFDKRVNFPLAEPETAQGIEDAVNISLSYRNALDVPFIAKLINTSEEHVVSELLQTGLAYINPATGLPEHREMYLSGFVRTKHRAAVEAAKADKKFQKNAEDLEKVIPADIPFTLLKFRLGTPWIPPKLVDNFIQQTLGVGTNFVYQPEIDKWLTGDRMNSYDARNTTQYGTSKFSGLQLVEHALNLQAPEVIVRVKNGDGTTTTYKDLEGTAEAQAKMADLINLFEDYVNEQKDQHPALEKIYNDKYNDFVEEKYQLPNFKHFPGAAKENRKGRPLILREHQRRAVIRGLRSSTYYAHQVGSGKTYTLITLAMEMRRLGRARKPLIVVQNATLEQFAESFKELYPAANLLVPTRRQMDSQNRQQLFNKIAYGDFDAIIIPQSFINFIPDDPERVKAIIQERIEELKAVLANVEDDEQGFTAKEIQNKIDKLEDDWADAEVESRKKAKTKDTARRNLSGMKKGLSQAARRRDDVFNFEEMGVDALLVDEAHAYKKLGFETKIRKVRGIDTMGSKRAFGIYLKARHIQEQLQGKNVIFSSGTPITNTIAEAWTVMKFMSPEILKRYGIETFDQFVSTFASIEPSFEFTAAGNFKTVDRLKSFVNTTELLKAFRSHVDVVLSEDVQEFKTDNSLPKLKNGDYTKIMIPQTDELKMTMEYFKDELRAWERLTGKEKRAKRHVPLVIFGRAKQAAIDLRLLNPKKADVPGSKTNTAVKEILRVYRASDAYQGTQLVFSDMYQSPDKQSDIQEDNVIVTNERFNLYQDIKKKLIKAGIPESEIAIVTDMKDEKRKQTFDAVQEGRVRVMLGSTEKMGVGVNVQNKLAAVHHIDAPPRPMDFEQRNGRIIRQGNEHAERGIPVEIITYGVIKTLDATAYQRLDFKQKFINQMMKGNVERVMNDEVDEDDPSDMGFQAMMSTLTGSQLAMVHFKLSFDLKKLIMAKKSFERRAIDLNKEKIQAQNALRVNKARIAEIDAFNEFLDKNFPDEKITSVKIGDDVVKEKMSEALDKVFEGMISDFKQSGKWAVDAKTIWLNEVLPLKMVIKMLDGEPTIKYSFTHPDQQDPLYEFDGYVKSGTGFMASVKSKFNNIREEKTLLPEGLKRNEQRQEIIQKELEKRFDKDDKIKALEKEMDELEGKMERENDHEAPPAPSDESDGNESGSRAFDRKPTLDTSNPTARRAAAPFNIAERIKGLFDKYGVPIQEKSLRKRYDGVFKHYTQGVRVQALWDVFTAAHEMMHAINKKHDTTNKIIGSKDRVLIKELKDAYKDLYPSPKKSATKEERVTEGLAVALQYYLADRNKVQTDYPEITKQILEPGGVFNTPMLNNFIADMQEVVNDYYSLKPEEQIGARIKWNATDKRKGLNLKQRLENEIFHDLNVATVVDRLQGGKYRADSISANVIMLKNSSSIASNWLQPPLGVKGPPMTYAADGRWVPTKDGYRVKDYLKMIKNPSDLVAFNEMLVARRQYFDFVELERLLAEIANETTGDPDIDDKNVLLKQLIEKSEKISSILQKNNIPRQQAEAAYNNLKDKYAAPLKIYDAINRELVYYMRNTGLITQEKEQEFLSKEGYASFRRYVEDEYLSDVSALNVSKSAQGKISSLREYRGSELQIQVPVFSQMLAVNEVIIKGTQNLTGIAWAEAAFDNVEVARLFEPVQRVEGKDNDPNFKKVYVDGHEKWFKTSQEVRLFYEALTPMQMGAVAAFFKASARLFQIGTTGAYPIFALMNIPMDAFTRFMFSKTGLIPVWHDVPTMGNVITGVMHWIFNIQQSNPNEFEKYLALGGRQATYFASQDLEPAGAIESMVNPTKVTKIKHGLEISLRGAELLTDLTELVGRGTEYARATKKGYPDNVAMLMASEVAVNFAAKGRLGGPFAQALVRSVPYMNVGFVALHQYFDQFKHNPSRVALGTAIGIALATTGALMVYLLGDDDEKDQLADQLVEEYGRWIFLPKSMFGADKPGLIKIRIPEQVGVWNTAVQIYLAHHYRNKPLLFKEFYKGAEVMLPSQLKFSQGPSVIGSYLPHAISPELQTIMNRRFYPELMPIVPEYMQDRDEYRQYDKYTSDLAILIGEVTRDNIELSPKKIDFYVRNKFGRATQLVQSLVESSITGEEVKAYIPINQEYDRFLFTGRMYNRFWDMREESKQELNALKTDPNVLSLEEDAQYDVLEQPKRREKFFQSVGKKISAYADIVNSGGALREDEKRWLYNMLNRITTDAGIDELVNEEEGNEEFYPEEREINE